VFIAYIGILFVSVFKKISLCHLICPHCNGGAATILFNGFDSFSAKYLI